MRTIRRSATGIVSPTRIKDGVDFLQQFNRDLAPLMHAWSAVWLAGNAEAINAANRFIDATTSAMGMASTKGAALPALLASIVGERWTEQQERDFQEALRKLGPLRGEFTDVARRETGEPTVDQFFAGIERTDARKSET